MKPFIPALSIRQPFATLIASNIKTIECRTRANAYRGYILIHAAKLWVDGSDGAMSYRQRFTIDAFNLPYDTVFPCGGIIGMARLVDCIRFTPDTWDARYSEHCNDMEYDPRTVGWVLSDIIAFPSLIPYPGRLNLFPVPTDLIPEQYQHLLEEVAV
jgi:hypothetical protein